MKFTTKTLFFAFFALASSTYYICPMQPPKESTLSRVKTASSAFFKHPTKRSPLNYSDLDVNPDAKQLTTETICKTVNERAKTFEIAAHQISQLPYVSHAFNKAANNPNTCQATVANLTKAFVVTDAYAWSLLQTKTAKQISLLHNNIHYLLPDTTYTTWVNTLASGRKLDSFEDAKVNWNFYNCPKDATPLIGSLYMDNYKLTRAIIAFGADPEKPDASGTTPLGYARRLDVNPLVHRAIKDGITQKKLEQKKLASTNKII
jgi:hypothetical protein